MAEKSTIVFDHGASLLHPPELIAAFVSTMTSRLIPNTINRERRSEPRYTISAIIEAQPVDDEFQPTGERFKAVTRDISAGGISFTHNRLVETKHLAVRLTNPVGEQLQTVMQILRCQRHNRTWDIAGTFVTKV
jgi:c-di-GMP-binding flagellar brake protein YcgR